MIQEFTGDKQKFNHQTLLVVSTTHSGDIYTLQNNTLQHVESVDVDLRPYPEKHGQLTSSSPSGNLQKAGMVYERDHEKEIEEYIDTMAQSIQSYLKEHDEEVLRILVTVPSQIKTAFIKNMKDYMHNIHINDLHVIEGNYGNLPLDQLISIIDSKNLSKNSESNK
jgi:hypothetical protein